jgi:hypothetical protein
MIYERVQCCRYCSRTMSESPRSFAENPYCSVCYEERVEHATRGVSEEGPVREPS